MKKTAKERQAIIEWTKAHNEVINIQKELDKLTNKITIYKCQPMTVCKCIQ